MHGFSLPAKINEGGGGGFSGLALCQRAISFSITIQIQLQFHLDLTQILTQWSLQNVAHDTTAVLVCAKVCCQTKASNWIKTKSNFPQNQIFPLDYSDKHVSNMNHWSMEFIMTLTEQ